MTVIAYKGGIIAADGRETWEDGGIGLCEKLFRIPKGPHKGHIVGTQGASSPGMVFVDWYTDPKSEKPKIQFEEEAFLCMVLRPDGVFIVDDHCRLIRCIEPVVAIGAGAPVALGAMAAGATAVQAVRIACKYNNLCGPPVKWMTLEPARRPKRIDLLKKIK